MVSMSAYFLSSAPRAASATQHLGRRLAVTIAALLAVIASMVTAAPAATALTVRPRTATERSIAVVVQTVMNAERKLHGLPPLRMEFTLIVSARRHNVRMAYYNTMSHQLPGEPYFATRMTQAGYKWTYAGENIAWNSAMTQAGVVTLQKLMYNEKPPNDGHRHNILNKSYRDVGIDVYMDKAHHKVWLTTDFGRR
jgi:uncharacterized protein YkwD